MYTVKPPNKGHFGSKASVLYTEVVFWWEVRLSLLFLALKCLANMYMYSSILSMISTVSIYLPGIHDCRPTLSSMMYVTLILPATSTLSGVTNARDTMSVLTKIIVLNCGSISTLADSIYYHEDGLEISLCVLTLRAQA